MVDFLGDGLKIHNRTGWNRFWLCLGVFLPPALIAGIYPDIFIAAIGIAGGIGEGFLNGILPIALVWVGRYRLGLQSDYALPGGKITLIILGLFAALIMGIEVRALLNQ